jgi:hypothetical protein
MAAKRTRDLIGFLTAYHKNIDYRMAGKRNTLSLQMLRGNLPKLNNLMAVGRDCYDAHDILTYFAQQIGKLLPAATCFIGQEGSTDFVLNHEGQKFFEA